ncbi:MAG: hypothetical protein ACLUTA_08610 [Blautia wexlerae]
MNYTKHCLNMSDDISLTEHVTKIKIDIDKGVIEPVLYKYTKSFSGVKGILLLIQRKRGSGRVPFLHFIKLDCYITRYYEHKVALDRMFRVVKTTANIIAGISATSL